MASITDKFGRPSAVDAYAPATTVKTQRTAGATVLECNDLSKFAADTPVYFLTYKKEVDPLTDEVTITSQTGWKGLVNSANDTITNLTIAPGYVDAGNAIDDFVECIPSSYWGNDLVDGMLASHNPDGTLKTDAVTTDSITDEAVTADKVDFATAALIRYSSGASTTDGGNVPFYPINANTALFAYNSTTRTFTCVAPGVYSISALLYTNQASAGASGSGEFIRFSMITPAGTNIYFDAQARRSTVWGATITVVERFDTGDTLSLTASNSAGLTGSISLSSASGRLSISRVI